MDFLDDIEELNDYETILETLNQIGNDLGFSFKRGQVQQK
jgi:hypothetical protein